jgi:hypothetical protein
VQGRDGWASLVRARRREDRCGGDSGRSLLRLAARGAGSAGSVRSMMLHLAELSTADLAGSSTIECDASPQRRIALKGTCTQR